MATRSALVLALAGAAAACEQGQPSSLPAPAPSPRDAVAPMLRARDASAPAPPDEHFCRTIDDPDAAIGVARVRMATDLYLDDNGCPADTARCKLGELAADDEVLTTTTLGPFTCVCRGSDCGYAPTRALEVIAQAPPRTWIGTWRNGGDQIVIARSGEMLAVRGHAVDNTHIGDVAGRGTPDAKGLLVIEQDDCVVRMRIVGRYLVVSDNSQCGGVNVRFLGVYAP